MVAPKNFLIGLRNNLSLTGFTRAKIIANPIAGHGKGVRVTQRLAAVLRDIGIEPLPCYTSRAGEARELARDTGDADLIICVGGVGTVNGVINGLLEGVIPLLKPLAILPIGAGNVIAKELHLSRNIKRFIRLVQAQKTALLDVGNLSWPCTSPDTSGSRSRETVQGWSASGETVSRKFISMAGSGFDAEVARRYQLARKGPGFHAHLFKYLPLGIRVLSSYEVPLISIEIDGRVQTTEASFVQVANAHSYGGPFTFVPQAQADDGWLDIVWYTGRTRWHILKYFWKAFMGDGADCCDACHMQGKKVVLSSPQRVPVQIDGDCCGYLPVEINIIPKAIAILVN